MNAMAASIARNARLSGVTEVKIQVQQKNAGRTDTPTTMVSTTKTESTAQTARR
jgi:hypothetical protein